MRIACIAASEVPSRKANSIRVMKVCQAFRKLGHAVRLWLPGEDPGVTWDSLSEQYRLTQSFEISWIPTANWLRRYDFGVKAVMQAREWSADLMYAWPLQSASFASLIDQATVFEVHDRPRGLLGPTLFRLMLRGRGLKRILPISESLETWLEQHYRFSRFRCDSLVIRSGVDLSGYHDLPGSSEARRQLGFRDLLTVGYTGHLYPGRGVELLYELAKCNPEVQFLWVGGTEEAIRSWQKKLSDEGIANILLPGFKTQEELPLYQAACDVLVMPYEKTIRVSSGANTEKFASPMKVFEYMAVGRAILSSDLPVLREILHEGIAVFAPPEDLEAWDHALKSLIQDQVKRARLAEASRVEAEVYSWEARAERALSGIQVGLHD
ncbi:MAG: glycosyltransferase [Anaerolineales bacterium]|jgi:glycosyltransferase involved in cell wall biosynthesis